MKPRMTVVIASACTRERGDALRRACESILSGNAHLTRVLVVANGPKCDSAVLAWLAAQPNVELVRIVSGSYPLARRVGAELAGTEFIAFLDDDDEYLPESVTERIQCLDAQPNAAALITNGLVCAGGTESPLFPPLDQLSPDPVLRTLQHGWQAAMVTLRTAAVNLSVLDTEVRQYEWTYTALCLALTKTVAVQDVVLFRYYLTPGSLSQGVEHVLAGPAFWDRVIAMVRGSKYERLARERQGRAMHDAAAVLLVRGELRRAWPLCLNGLIRPGGLVRYGLVARLIWASLRQFILGGANSAGPGLSNP
jgi:glycosyltransferase involved in cell wall biosynthesis